MKGSAPSAHHLCRLIRLACTLLHCKTSEDWTLMLEMRQQVSQGSEPARAVSIGVTVTGDYRFFTVDIQHR